uniref:Single stranded DNA binding protein 4 n=1 Tax=Esox lucius TaxID=8010 RepID=A0A6Q2ZJJ7_ESOLU
MGPHGQFIIHTFISHLNPIHHPFLQLIQTLFIIHTLISIHFIIHTFISHPNPIHHPLYQLIQTLFIIHTFIPHPHTFPSSTPSSSFHTMSSIHTLSIIICLTKLSLCLSQPFMSPRFPGGPRPSLRMPNQPPGGIPGSQPLLPNSMDPTRPQGHPNMGGPMRMNAPRGMGPMGPQNYGGMRPPPNSMGGPMPGMNMGPGGRGPWPGPNANSIQYSSSSPGNYVGPPGGGGPPGTPIMPSPGDSNNSSENIYTMMNPIGPGGNRPNFPMGPGPDGPMGAMGAMEPHHMNGSLGSGDMDGLPKNSPNNMGGMSNPPGTPRDDGEMGGNFLNPFQSESYSPNMTMSV